MILPVKYSILISCLPPPPTPQSPKMEEFMSKVAETFVASLCGRRGYKLSIPCIVSSKAFKVNAIQWNYTGLSLVAGGQAFPLALACTDKARL